MLGALVTEQCRRATEYTVEKKRKESLERRKVTNIMQGREEDAQRKTKEIGYP